MTMTFNIKKIFFYISVVTAILVATIFFYIHIYLNSVINKESDKIIFVEKGDSFIKFADKLVNDGIIKNKRLFITLTQIKTGFKIKIHRGEFLFEKDTTINQAMNKIINNDLYYRTITFAEGLSNHSIIEILNNNKYLTGEVADDLEEGSLLPETYSFVRGDSRQSVLDDMHKKMNETIDKYWETRAENLPIKTKQEAIILASIIEKETGLPEERDLVASVFINRLKKRMKLQTDPTVVYAFTFGDKSKERSIRRSDLKNRSPYNTYVYYGLPPTPICNPSEASIKSALNPANSDYLYFVVKSNNMKGHNFSETYKKHRKFVQEYRKN